ncbi:hypothetical protein [Fortiea contorta]|uniref:hypothetical protein n=1 Tax=Fortiea contorta TaxID=1892405 RepID=UPI0003469419|nr:hypothetical protein [Fortiea contorta]
MTYQINALDTFASLPSAVELEFIAALLEPEDANYPWNPADVESEAYFSEIEQQFVIDDLLEEQLTARSTNFYNQLDTLWDGLSNVNTRENHDSQSLVSHIQETLQTAFAASVPQGWLQAIAQKATEIFSTQQSIGEQLVECVQTVLPTWEVEDLLVLARPYAYAMRSSESQNLPNVGNRDWATLSEIEQAKVSLAISYYALRQLNNSDQ